MYSSKTDSSSMSIMAAGRRQIIIYLLELLLVHHGTTGKQTVELVVRIPSSVISFY